MFGVTVFTPTYNRENTLQRCYDSIVSQKCSALEWIIVDDGSVDNTRKLVDKFIEENKLTIRYVYQSNSGKQAAWNRALSLAKYKYFIGLDSDDCFCVGALAKIFQLESYLSDDRVIGIRALSISSESKEPSNCYLLNNDRYSSWFDELRSGKHGERIDIFKTDILRKYKYPVSGDVKFVPEVWLYSQISKDYKFYYTSTQVRVFFDNANENRLSRSSLSAHALGHYLARKSLLENAPISVWLNRPVDFLKTIIRLNQVVRLLNINPSEIKNRVILFLVLPAIILTKTGGKIE